MFKRNMFERCNTFLRQEMQTTTKMYFSFKNVRGANAYPRSITVVVKFIATPRRTQKKFLRRVGSNFDVFRWEQKISQTGFKLLSSTGGAINLTTTVNFEISPGDIAWETSTTIFFSSFLFVFLPATFCIALFCFFVSLQFSCFFLLDISFFFLSQKYAIKVSKIITLKDSPKKFMTENENYFCISPPPPPPPKKKKNKKHKKTSKTGQNVDFFLKGFTVTFGKKHKKF